MDLFIACPDLHRMGDRFLKNLVKLLQISQCTCRCGLSGAIARSLEEILWKFQSNLH